MTTDDLQPPTPLVLVRGDATAEEVAALVTVLHSLSAARASTQQEPAPRAEWGAAHRTLRASYPAGPGGWRASGLPR